MSPRKHVNNDTPSFSKPYYFSRHRSNKWTCNLCTSPNQMTPQKALAHEASLEHSNNAAMNESNWWGAPESNWHIDAVSIVDRPSRAPLNKEAMKEREHRYFADQVDDLIPFWIRGVKAAEHGQVLRLADFLDSLEEGRDIWPPRVPNPWRNPEAQSFIRGKGRSKDGWSPDRERVENCWQGWDSHPGSKSGTSWGSEERNGFSVKGEKKRKDMKQWRTKFSQTEGHDFVEEIAVQDAVDDARKREMHVFYDLPTSEKVQRIENLIRTLRGS